MSNAIPAKFKLVSALAFAIASATSAHAFTGTIGSTATIISPITLTEGAPLAFGSILTSGTSGTVSIAPSAAGTSTFAGGVSGINSTRTAAKINVSGSGNLAYNISVVPTVTLTGPGPDMTASLSLDAPDGMLSNGSATHYVGASLNVGANQTGGAYSGSFAVTVNYQ